MVRYCNINVLFLTNLCRVVFGLGINDGKAARKTIYHLQLHLIPLYKGDIDNPRGGVRHIIPGKGNY